MILNAPGRPPRVEQNRFRPQMIAPHRAPTILRTWQNQRRISWWTATGIDRLFLQPLVVPPRTPRFIPGWPVGFRILRSLPRPKPAAVDRLYYIDFFEVAPGNPTATIAALDNINGTTHYL
jgi:hypothetical protein